MAETGTEKYLEVIHGSEMRGALIEAAKIVDLGWAREKTTQHVGVEREGENEHNK